MSKTKEAETESARTNTLDGTNEPSNATWTPPDPAAATPEPGKHGEHIDTWFAKHFHNLGPLLDTRLYNILQAAKEDLKAVLAKL